MDEHATASHQTTSSAAQDGDLDTENVAELLRILTILAGHWRFITGATLVGAVLTGLVALLLPNKFTATAVIMPPQKEQSTASALSGQLGSLAAMAGSDMGIKSPTDLYVGLLGSRTIADHLIASFRLRSLYGVKTATKARSRLKSRTRITAGKDSLIKIEVTDTDPRRAADMANAYAFEVNQLNKGLAVSDAARRRAFMERQLSQEKTALADAEVAMKETQSRLKLIQPDAQATVAIGYAAQLSAQITAGEVAIERLRMGATANNPELLRSEAELDAMRAQLKKFETGRGGSNTLPATSSMPEANLSYIRRLRELKYHEYLFELLSKQYEAARLDESKAAPDLPTVDPAVPPDEKSSPHRLTILLVGCGVAAILASLATYTRHSFKSRPPGRPLT
jgi:tyrosine-protein kinase Etk/Wzc